MGYKAAPWVFTGRALYQLQLVKAEEARKYIPSELKLVELFGYTLGGFYLARYADSPVGAFDEMVALAGLVWNPPTSCAWAARVYVNNKEARTHGLKHVGLPSRTCSFSQPSSSHDSGASTSSTTSHSKRNSSSSSSNSQGLRRPSWWDPSIGDTAGDASTSDAAKPGKPSPALVELHNTERGRRGLPDGPVCSMLLPAVKTWGFLGPRLRLSLPSFSGGTLDVPGLLKYSCLLHTNVMPVPCTRVLLTAREETARAQQHEQGSRHSGELLDAVLGGKPLLALAFSDMVMTVDEPTMLALPAPAPEQSSKLVPVAAVVSSR